MTRGAECADVVVAGAGCAGLSLAAALAGAGPAAGRVLVVDERVAFARDRTWCYWNVRPHPFAEAVTHRWGRWRVVAPDGTPVVRGSRRYAYHHVPADAFYRAALSRIARAGHVELRLGECVHEVEDTAAGALVRTARGAIQAKHVFDSRPRAARASGAPPTPAPSRPPARLAQAFAGAVLRTPSPRFDPGAVTLMDFTAEWGGAGFAFGYVLPYAPDHALVELAVIAPEPPPPAQLEFALTRYAARVAGGAYQVRSREGGVIPMDAAPTPRRPSPHVTRVGVAGGMAKPSTGYAFLAIQQDAVALARATVTGTLGPNETVPAPRSPVARWLDHVFLRRLLADPAAAPRLFTSLFASAESDALVRFLSDVPSPADVARVVAALPPLPFVAEAVRMVA